jgi:uncharacterized protein (DUF58 family)
MAQSHGTLQLTARGTVVAALAAASLFGATLSGDANVRLAAGLLLAPLIVDFARKPRGLGSVALRVAPRRTVVGARFHEPVRLDNSRGSALREVLLHERHRQCTPAFVAAVPRGGDCTVALPCASPQRGHQLERVFELSTEWPLGLFRRTAVAVVAADLVTEPRRENLRDDPLASLDELQHALQARTRLLGEEFHALREHQVGEDARGVHALRSAALATLVRTVLRGRLPSQVGIVLDLRRPPGRPLQLGHRRFEWSLGAAATLLDRLCAAACTVQLWVLGSRTVHTVVRDSRLQREVLTFLAEAAPSPHRALPPQSLDGLSGMDRCFWIPAGGQRPPAGLPASIEVLGGHE